MFGNLSEEESKRFLTENIYGRIGCHAFGKTYIVPISYAHKDGTIYCHSVDDGGLKIKMMRNNPDVCFQVDRLDDMANWKSIVSHGRFRELEDAERNDALKILLERRVPAVVSETIKLSPDWPFPSEDYDKIPGAVFAISVDEISGRFEQSDAVMR